MSNFKIIGTISSVNVASESNFGYTFYHEVQSIRCKSQKADSFHLDVALLVGETFHHLSK